jgi:hypothetical protein
MFQKVLANFLGKYGKLDNATSSKSDVQQSEHAAAKHIMKTVCVYIE